MKLLTANFLCCARKSCGAYPLDFVETVAEDEPSEVNAQFIINILPRVDWAAIQRFCNQVCVL